VANFAAIAAAGKTLERLLDTRLGADTPVPGYRTRAWLVRTNDFALGADTLLAFPALSVYLMRVDVNHTMRAAWSAVGSVDGRSHLPLDLHFMLTAWAQNAEWELRIMGCAMGCLDENPILSGPQLDASTGADWDFAESLQIIPEEMSTEAVMRTWDSLDGFYRLSVPYVVRIVRVDSEVPPPIPPVVAAIGGMTPTVDTT
jgi:hypothetical protein